MIDPVDIFSPLFPAGSVLNQTIYTLKNMKIKKSLYSMIFPLPQPECSECTAFLAKDRQMVRGINVMLLVPFSSILECMC